ncbi:hypothetical protein Tco_1232438, partial [Tanacetum coccineum]
IVGRMKWDEALVDIASVTGRWLVHSGSRCLVRKILLWALYLSISLASSLYKTKLAEGITEAKEALSEKKMKTESEASFSIGKETKELAVMETIRMDNMDFFEMVNHFFNHEMEVIQNPLAPERGAALEALP